MKKKEKKNIITQTKLGVDSYILNSQDSEDIIFMMQTMKRNVIINWLHDIIQYMWKDKINNMPLSYGFFITYFLA